jgi:hypothetical protein
VVSPSIAVRALPSIAPRMAEVTNSLYQVVDSHLSMIFSESRFTLFRIML